ncbi:MAG: FkbM family methyltransferase [Devosia sp.]
MGAGTRLAAEVLWRLHRASTRRLQPRLRSRYAGVAYEHDQRLGDATLRRWRGDPTPESTADRPDYEAGLVRGLKSAVRPGDRVTVIGGGYGITTVIAAQLAGPASRVTCFEASSEQVRLMRRTLTLNGVAGRVQVRREIVGDVFHVYGGASRVTRIAPQDLPDCDVLEMDCEGSERRILSDMTIRPREIVVETHGFYHSHTPVVRAILEQRGYAVKDLGIAEPDLAQMCIDNDVRVLHARRIA